MEETDCEKVFRIFISHKQIDHKLAMLTKEALQDLSGKTKVACFVSGVDIPAGNEWNRVIKSELKQSDLLLLLFTNPSKNWDWCLYEAGLFTRFEVENVTSVVCLYNPGSTPPTPLNNLQGIPAQADKVERFLKRLFRETRKIVDGWENQALSPLIGDKRLEKSAKSICHGFQVETTSHPCHRVVLDLSSIPADEIKDEIPESAIVVEGPGCTSAFTLSIFGCAIGSKKHTWGELLSNIDGHRELWRTQLDKAFAGGRRETLFDPVSATLRSWKERRLYKPVLYRIVHTHESNSNRDDSKNQGQNRPIEITIIFEHVFAPMPVGDPLFNLIRTYTRFRIEVFEEFGGRMAMLAADADTRSQITDRLLATIRLIESESTSYGLFDARNIRAAFGIEKKSELKKMNKRWFNARQQLDQVVAEPTLLDEHLTHVEQILAEMQTINRTCSIWANERYLKILKT